MTSARQRGLTMVELVMFIVIVGIAVVGVLSVISLNTRASADPIRQKQAMAIAESLVDEIRAARFSWCDAADPNYVTATSGADCANGEEKPGLDGRAMQRPFDNVNDYVTNWGVAAPYASDVIGTPFPAGYAATVTITPTSIGPAASAVPATESLRVVVTVAYGGEAVTLETYRTRHAPNN
ncbi:type II secretion system protein [Massilia sp. METH4]|uniref:type IV pilus modification PilV family protein n=1 Tax=Massilia sp. METH4 TaxID=3123041 RepID=UPI0030CC594A